MMRLSQKAVLTLSVLSQFQARFLHMWLHPASGAYASLTPNGGNGVSMRLDECISDRIIIHASSKPVNQLVALLSWTGTQPPSSLLGNTSKLASNIRQHPTSQPVQFLIIAQCSHKYTIKNKQTNKNTHTSLRDWSHGCVLWDAFPVLIADYIAAILLRQQLWLHVSHYY